MILQKEEKYLNRYYKLNRKDDNDNIIETLYLKVISAINSMHYVCTLSFVLPLSVKFEKNLGSKNDFEITFQDEDLIWIDELHTADLDNKNEYAEISKDEYYTAMKELFVRIEEFSKGDYSVKVLKGLTVK